MKVCFITDTIFNLGGVQRVVSVLASELSKQHNVTILCTDDNYALNRELYNLAENVNVDIDSSIISISLLKRVYYKIFKEINKYTNILDNSVLCNFMFNMYFPNEIRKRCIEYFNKRDYDVIIGVEGFYSILIGSISDKLNAKTIGWQHNSYDAYFKSKFRYYWNQDVLFKTFIPKLDKYIVLTDSDKEVINYNFNIDSYRIYNPLSFESKEKSKCDKKVILFVGRLVIYQKGIDLLIEAFSRICNINGCNDWILKIVGDGPDKEAIRKLIQKYGLENKIMLEPFTKNIEMHYLNSSIFVSSSRWEGFGLVITEAMECGLPVIAFNNSGPKEIIDKTNGILINNGDIDSLSNSMKMLILNDSYRMNLAEKSVERANDFSKKKIISYWNEIICMD